MRPPLHLPFLLITLLLVSPVRGKSFSMKRHKTESEHYRQHLARRGFSVGTPERADAGNMKRGRTLVNEQNGASRAYEPGKRGRLVTRYHPEYDPYALSNDVSNRRRKRRQDATTIPPLPSASDSAGASALSSTHGPSTSPPLPPSPPSAHETHQGDAGRWAAAVDNPTVPAETQLNTSPLPLNTAPAASSISPQQSNPALPSSHAPIPLTNQRGIVYTIEATIGGDPTKIPILVDTGSSTFWVAAKQCQSCPPKALTQCLGCGNPQFGIVQSTIDLPEDQCPKEHERNSIFYGTGSVFGCPVRTTVTIEDLTLADFPVLGVTRVDQVQARLGQYYSGILGLGSQTINQLDKTPVDAWYENHAIVSKDIGFYFVRDGDPGTSQLVLGGALDVDELNNIPIDKGKKAVLQPYGPEPRHFDVILDKMTVWGNTIPGFTNRHVILDTGSTNLNFPREAMESIYGFLGNGTLTTFIESDHTLSYVLNCTLLPPHATVLSLTFGGVEFGIQFRDLHMGPVPGFEDYCYGRVGHLNDEVYLLGDAFLINVYHSVNVVNGQVTMYGLTK